MIKPADHPIWPLVRLIVLMIAMTVVLWLNASHFDATEIRSIIYTFVAAASAEGAAQLFSRKD